MSEQADPDPELDALTEVYARHTPADGGTAEGVPLREVARAHRALAARRMAGEPLVRVEGRVAELVTDDMPFLVGSMLAAVDRAGGTVVRLLHPIVVVRRDAVGDLLEVLPEADPAQPPPGALAESWIRLELDGITDPEGLAHTLRETLHDVREVVEDGDRMERRALSLADELPPGEVADFLRWLADDHYTFLGYRHYTAAGGVLTAEPASGLGVLRGDALGSGVFAPDGGSEQLILTRAGMRSRVLRAVHPYVVGLRTFAPDGTPTGEHRFLGMLTVPALYESVLDIPVVAGRVLGAIQRAGFPVESFSGQQMLEILSGLPREELFSASEEYLHDIAVGVLGLSGRRAVRPFLRFDPHQRFVSCLVYLPRDRYTTTSRLAMAAVLREQLHGSVVDYTARVTEATYALVHFTVHTDAEPARPDPEELTDALTEAARTWDDRLVARLGPKATTVPGLLAGIPDSYKAGVSPDRAVEDLRRILALPEHGFDVRLYPAGDERRLTLYLDEPVTLTRVLPILQHLGVEVVDEHPSEFTRPDGRRCWLYDFGLRIVGDSGYADESQLELAFCAAFRATWSGEAEADRFSALVLRAGLHWREAAVLRAYARYARQVGSTFGVNYMAETLCSQPAVARGLVRLFRARFDPAAAERAKDTDEALAEVTALIDEVTGLDADRILRGYLAMIIATLRTNWFRDRPFLSLKIDPTAVPDMPAPRPRFEIFVYSPRVEGVHLRFGPVARGGLRWSDRPQDFRTEILGLVKAQAVKNAVIVPVGAKGGFVVRTPAPDPAEVEACYRTFVSGLLDVTDNLVDGRTVPPENVVRHDGDDSYLVVAADKGTARFSDVANDVAASYGFWLGDAFASGGSVGYDHKAMGITARGAWESVKRHFLELGVDTQTRDFTVVGVGDMSGDVFGNGMLLSEHIRLVAAFDHRHVFVDPTPDAAVGFAERARMFALPRSSWDDYSRALISPGGGVWPRTAKSVPVGPEMRAALGIPDHVTALSPPELIHAILLAPADLLWNGGIGTYVKASTETHADAGDKANDAIRVDGRELRVRVVGEGGNLGLTQKGRIEFARSGGRVNTDAIDNSAGVDCSDHEVNIKILLDRTVAAGALEPAARNALLAEMTDEVADLVLADNVDQNSVLGVARSHAPEMANVHARLVADLEERTGLDRALEVLPTAAGFAALEEAGQGLTGPELSTLIAHVKLDLTHRLLDTDLPDVAAFAARLPEYFPHPLRQRFPAEVREHPLRREILATMLVNEMVDGAGITYAFRLAEETAAGPADAVRAYAVVTDVYGLPGRWREMREAPVEVAVSDRMILESRRLLDRASRWFLGNRPQPLAVGAETARFGAQVRELRDRLTELLAGREAEAVRAHAARLVAEGVPEWLAVRAATQIPAYALLDVVDLVELSERDGEPRPPEEVARVYFALSDHLGVDIAQNSVNALPRGDRWHQLARLALRDDLYGSLRAITLDALRVADPGTPVAETIAQWEKANASRLLRARTALQEIASAPELDLATLSVVSRQLRSLAR
ncbi:NAD-glutamate dehydrogenase [Pseudonocardia sp. WMMC193]|uniref:NAD-glutamate dehydrogenase n=1 Tax=Pseudonocardia sp. WMMC193 TaxID=2911965 RepID=UPI001F26C135|nr:NAD-glutamate dehydrogenase [Pseudonocardia sp. WMMC193]MCF7547651.1 NAD-glutamate dehydrogenase [Pseudonocardia sp. WMMC193]